MMGPLVAAGAILVPGQRLRNLEIAVEKLCQNHGFPVDDPLKSEFKWSPGPRLWIRDNLVCERREKFFLFFKRLLDWAFPFLLKKIFVHPRRSAPHPAPPSPHGPPPFLIGDPLNPSLFPCGTRMKCTIHRTDCRLGCSSALCLVSGLPYLKPPLVTDDLTQPWFYPFCPGSTTQYYQRSHPSVGPLGLNESHHLVDLSSVRP
jgi:hypothetical protein